MDILTEAWLQPLLTGRASLPCSLGWSHSGEALVTVRIASWYGRAGVSLEGCWFLLRLPTMWELL